VAQGKLTALALSWLHKSDKDVTASDGGYLYFRKRREGGSSWILRYKFHGQPRKIRIGTYPDMTLAEARIEARKARVMLDKKEDPLLTRAEAKKEFQRRASFSQLCEDWFSSEVLGRSVKRPQAARSLLDMYIIPSLGKMAVVDIQPLDVTRMLDGVKKRFPTTANAMLRTTRRVFSFAVRRRIVLTNPTYDLNQRLDAGGTEKSRSRALNLDELARLLAALRNTPSFGTENLLLTKLLLALCVRKGELMAARWEEFDLEGCTMQGPVWHLPGARTKTGEPLDIPLVPQVVDWFERLRVIGDDSPWVFPRRRYDRHAEVQHASGNTLNAALLRVEHGLEHFTVHDLRRTARTQLAALGIRREVAEKCLGHKLRGVEGTYDRYDYFKERRAALTRWANVLVEAEEGSTRVAYLHRR
jgi:integrase